MPLSGLVLGSHGGYLQEHHSGVWLSFDSVERIGSATCSRMFAVNPCRERCAMAAPTTIAAHHPRRTSTCLPSGTAVDIAREFAKLQPTQKENRSRLSKSELRQEKEDLNDGPCVSGVSRLEPRSEVLQTFSRSYCSSLRLSARDFSLLGTLCCAGFCEGLTSAPGILIPEASGVSFSSVSRWMAWAIVWI